jgi:pre-mRNA-processing factor 17
MDLLAEYDDGSQDSAREPMSGTLEEASSSGRMSDSPPSSPESASPIRLMELKKSAAPEISDSLLLVTPAGATVGGTTKKPIDPSQHKVNYNPTFEQLWAPIAGPAHPYAKDGMAQGLRNHKLGFVEDAAIAPFMFDEQYNTFHTYGYAADPGGVTGNNIVGDASAVHLNDGASVYNLPQHEHRKRKLDKKRAREPSAEGDLDEEEIEKRDNPASEDWLLKNTKSPWSGKKEGLQGELTEEQKKYAEEHAEKKGEKEKTEKVETEDKSTFHGKEEVDYQGRSWITPPKDVKATNDHCYIPKRWVHTWSGHTKGVSAIRFFPKYGHLLLSASMDTKVKIWDVHGSGKCMRTYMGHSKAVRDICFNNDGSKFLTASYDRKIKLWDTETGKVVSSFSTGKIPYVVKFNPDEDKQNVLLAGMSDKKIVQWDMNTGDITQEYDQHLGAVNTITFVDNNRRFVTSSDDKSLRVWEFGIPVVIKYISEPHMHSMPSITVHPNTNWLAAQSLDNQILIYSTRERFRLNKKKRFAGHIVAGYACQVNFSPDGRFIMSGDGEGRCWFWDWKTCKVFRTLKCHEGVCIGAEWHPLEQSKVATCGWDGLIKYWYSSALGSSFLHQFNVYATVSL